METIYLDDNNEVILTLKTKQQSDDHSEYSSQPFTPKSIRGDLASMDRVLHDAKQDAAALVCSNAERMILRLETLIHESLFPLGLASDDLERGDIESAQRRLASSIELLSGKVVMIPELNGGWAKAPTDIQ